MRIAIVSDIHANLAALEAVLAAIGPVQRIVCCGDMVGYYDQPNDVCSLVREHGIECIRGNHDAYVTGALCPKEENRALYRTDWTRAELAETHLRWLESLGTQMEIVESGRRLQVRHASPWDEETYLYADAENALARVVLARHEVLAVGHTHRPLLLAIGEGRLLNPGSVGQPRDRDPRPSYATLDLATGEVEHHRVSYDVETMQRRLAHQGWEPRMISMLSRTRES